MFFLRITNLLSLSQKYINNSIGQQEGSNKRVPRLEAIPIRAATTSPLDAKVSPWSDLIHRTHQRLILRNELAELCCTDLTEEETLQAGPGANGDKMRKVMRNLGEPVSPFQMKTNWKLEEVHSDQPVHSPRKQIDVQSLSCNVCFILCLGAVLARS